MERITMNQWQCLDNRFQKIKEHKRVLCVCNAGLLRSATMQRVLAEKYNYNTRCVGVDDYALIKLTEALLLWADEIVCAEPVHLDRITLSMQQEKMNTVLIDEIIAKAKILYISDLYQYMDEELQKLILERYEETK